MSQAPTTTSPSRLRWVILLVLTGLVLAGAGIYAVSAFQRLQATNSAAPAVALAPNTAAAQGARVLFRNTATGQGYGMAATVPLSDPAGARSLSSVPCDRVYQAGADVMCLATERGMVTRFDAALLDSNWQELQKWALAGIPSRTRASADGNQVATTVFVTGHSYAGTGFSTETVITHRDGAKETENLEDFALMVNGAQLSATDRNIWGVTFIPGQPDAFYATAASGGRHWLVRGSQSQRTLTAVADGVECPSISPDGTRVAYKTNISTGLTPQWKIAVLDLASGKSTTLGETRNVDDQVEWLDDSTLLYGLLRDDTPGDSDIWQIPADNTGAPAMYIEHAWSPSVVR